MTTSTQQIDQLFSKLESASPPQTIFRRCGDLVHYAETVTITRSEVKQAVEYGYDNYIIPLINQWDPPGKRILIWTLRKIVIWASLKAYDKAAKWKNN